MPEALTLPTLFLLVFLGQVLVGSLFVPHRIIQRAQYILDHYPPADYPRLYPDAGYGARSAIPTYRVLNLVVLLIGLGLAGHKWMTGAADLFRWDNLSVIALYGLLQYLPLLVAHGVGLVYFSPRRRHDSRSTRRAELAPRRLFDFVSPWWVGLSVAAYVGFGLFVAYLRRFDFPWFAGYWNVAILTLGNLFFAAMIFRLLRGKTKDPYQQSDDRRRQIALTIQLLVITSIITPIFIAITVTFNALDRSPFVPLLTSLLFQVLMLLSLRTYRIDDVAFEVYRDDPVAVGESGSAAP